MRQRLCFAVFITLATLGTPHAPALADVQSLLKSAQDALGSGAGSAIGDDQAAGGLKAALAQGAEVAVSTLARENGFYGDPQLRIPLPGMLDTVGQGLRLAGQGEQVDAFVLSMNRAAEAAVPAALDVLKETIAKLTIQDAVGILQGGDTAATEYLRRAGGETIRARMKPYIAEATDQVGVTRYYKALTSGDGGAVGQLSGLLGGKTSLDVDDYVTEQATDGLFTLIAAEERRIRENPAARTSGVFAK